MRLRAVAAVDAGPRAVLPVLAIVALLVGVAGLLILVLGSAAGAAPRANVVMKWCLVVLAAAAVVSLVARRYLPRREPRDVLTAAMLAATALLPLLLLPIHYMAARTHPRALWWNSYGFLDKRWLTSLFLIVTLGSVVLLVVAGRLVARSHTHPRSWREWVVPARSPDGSPVAESRAAPRSRPRAWAITGLKVLVAVLVAGYFFAPPWNLPATPIDYHETLTMGGVQAIRTGSIPYIDAAAVQYGPAAQLANYAYSEVTGQISVDAFRQTSLLFNWLAASLFLGALFLRVRPLVAAVTTVAAFTIFPILQMFSVTSSGFLRGFWGWGNPLRYAGVFVLAMAFPAIVARTRTASVRWGALALGVGWGLLCLIAQENLIGGALVLGVLSLVLVASDTAGWRHVVNGLAATAAGFLLVAVPVCVYYAAHGKLGRFFELYLLVPQAVAAGYSNTHFDNRVWAPLFYALPVLLGVLLIAALVETRPLRIATRWPVRRVVLVSALLAAVVSHLGALTRSDAPHLKNTMLALPAALCLAAFYLPGLLGARGRARWIGGLAIGAVVLAFLPMTVRSFEPALIPQKLWRPLTSRVNPPDPKPLPSGVPKNSIAASRIGKATFRRGPCCNSTDAVPMGQFARFLDRLHALVGSRRVFVDSSPGVVPPAVYFLADLRPATLPQDYGTMVINGDIRRQWFRYFRRHLGQIDAVVSTKPGRRGPRLWAARFPSHRTITMPVGQKTVTVYLR